MNRKKYKYSRRVEHDGTKRWVNQTNRAPTEQCICRHPARIPRAT